MTFSFPFLTSNLPEEGRKDDKVVRTLSHLHFSSPSKHPSSSVRFLSWASDEEDKLPIHHLIPFFSISSAFLLLHSYASWFSLFSSSTSRKWGFLYKSPGFTCLTTSLVGSWCHCQAGSEMSYGLYGFSYNNQLSCRGTSYLVVSTASSSSSTKLHCAFCCNYCSLSMYKCILALLPWLHSSKLNIVHCIALDCFLLSPAAASLHSEEIKFIVLFNFLLRFHQAVPRESLL